MSLAKILAYLISAGVLVTLLEGCVHRKKAPPDPVSAGTEIVERGQDFLVLQNVSETTAGQRVTNRFTLLEHGLHYNDGQGWKLSEDLIEDSPQGATARRGPNQALFSHDLNVPEVFDVRTPSGQRLRGGVRSLHLTDTATGRSVIIGTVRQSVPGQLEPPNRIVFQNAFDGAVRADVILIWRHNAFAQQVVLRSRPVLPDGFAAETAKLEVATEFIDPPEARLSEAREQRAGPPELADNGVISLGGISLVPSRAFRTNELNAPRLSTETPVGEGMPVAKRWERQPNGRTYLVEALNWPELLPSVQTLEAAPAERTSELRPTATRALAPGGWTVPEKKVMEIAPTPYRPTGLVIERVMVPETSQVTFLAGITYLVRTTYYIGSAVVFQPGCVIKNYAAGALILYGPSINFPASGPPCVFTSIDDDLYGGRFPGSVNPPFPASDGNPENIAPNPRISDTLRIWNVNYSTLVQNAIFRWGDTGIEYFNTGPLADHTISNCRFENITWAGLNNAVTATIGPGRTVSFVNSTKCNVDNDCRPSQASSVSGSLTVDCAVSDATVQSGHEVEPAIVARQLPSGQTRVVIVSIYRDYPPTNGISHVRAISNDGGTTWSRTRIADGAFKEADGVTPMMRGRGDPTLAYDGFGNLFLSYNGILENNQLAFPLYVSTNNGDSFSLVSSFTVNDPVRDLPKLATGYSGPGTTNQWAVWLSYFGTGGGRVRGTRVTGLGVANISTNWIDRMLPNGTISKLTAPAVGPAGQLVVSYVDLFSDITNATYTPWPPRTLRTAIDPDGLGPANLTEQNSFPLNFGWESLRATGYFSEVIPIPALAWDRPRNKLYLSYHARPMLCGTNFPYTAAHEPCASDTDVYVKIASPASTVAWTNTVRVNNDPATSHKSQFHPRVAVDENTGNVGVSWYDCRLSTNNDRAHFFAAISRDAFATTNIWNFQVNPASSSAVGFGLGYWDYTGLAYYNGVLYPAWQDNSNSTTNNPDGNCCTNKYDTYVGKIRY